MVVTFRGCSARSECSARVGHLACTPLWRTQLSAQVRPAGGERRAVLRLRAAGGHDGAGRGRPRRPRARPADRAQHLCHVDPPPAVVPVLSAMVEGGVAVTDVLERLGLRPPGPRALGARRSGALGATHRDRPASPRPRHPGHPRRDDPSSTATSTARRRRGRCWSSNHWPATATGRADRRPRRADAPSWPAYKLGRMTADDPDGYHRVMCPAAMGKVRCPLRPDSMALAHDRPEVLAPPEHPPRCCVQKTITVPRLGHRQDGPEARLPLQGPSRDPTPGARAAERTFSTVKDPASNDIARGWCRLTGPCRHHRRSSLASSSCATSGSSTPSRPAKPSRSGASRLASHRAHGADAVGPSEISSHRQRRMHRPRFRPPDELV